VDPFAAIVLGGVAVILISMWLIGRHYPGSGLEQVGLRSAREIIETREALEAEDLEQMVGAYNVQRQARGLRPVSAEEMELRVAGELGEQERRRAAYLAERERRRAEDAAEREGGQRSGGGSRRAEDAAERELSELLEATNRRRRARGLPERTAEQARAEFGSRGGDGG